MQLAADPLVAVLGVGEVERYFQRVDWHWNDLEVQVLLSVHPRLVLVSPVLREKKGIIYQ